jgi:hypothetical protein
VKVRSNGPEIDDEASIGFLTKSIARGLVDGVRHNKLAAVLATVTMIVLTALAVDSRFDGLPHYREFILPRLLRLEGVLLKNRRAAENASGEWREYYFKEAHSQVRDILRAGNLDRPAANLARRKHQQFLRHYGLLDSEFTSIRIQMRAKPNLDYLRQLNNKMEELKPIRDVWAQWAISEKGDPPRREDAGSH